MSISSGVLNFQYLSFSKGKIAIVSYKNVYPICFFFEERVFLPNGLGIVFQHSLTLNYIYNGNGLVIEWLNSVYAAVT